MTNQTNPDDIPPHIHAGYLAVHNIINAHPGTAERNAIIWKAVTAYQDEQPTHEHHPTRGGAVWCSGHKRWECTKNAKEVRGGNRCHGIAILGLDRCRMHAGETAELAKAKGEAVSAWSALSGKATIVPAEAVLGMLQMSWLRVHIYAGLLEEQVTAAQAGREETLVDYEGGDGAGPVGAGVGLVGHTFAAVKDIGIYASGEAVRALVQLEAAERDRCVKYAKTAHDMGIAEQQVKLAEQQGLMLAEVIRRVLGALNLSPEQRALVPTVVPVELRKIMEGQAL